MSAAPQDEVTPRVTLEAWLVTDVGVVRDHNEDSAYMESTRGFFIVADGMGGHAAGEVASAMAVESVRKSLEDAQPEIDAFRKAPTDVGRRALVQLLQNSVLGAHQAVYQSGQAEQDKAGMGTTLDVVLVAGPEAFVAHVGDSRTYLIRDGRPSQITTDHTVAEVLVIEGKLTIEEAQVSPLRTILVNAIGVSADVGVEMAHVTLKRGDRILLCSDGLHDYFPLEDEIAQKLSSDTPGDSLAEMVELAKTRGGHDNITGVAVLVTEIVDGGASELETDETQPVEVSTNPFADEPTETAFMAPPGLPPRMVAPALGGAGGKATQPMRIVPEAQGGGDTLPPAAGPLGGPSGSKPTDAAAAKELGERPTDPKLVIAADPDADKPADKAADKTEKRKRRKTQPEPIVGAAPDPSEPAEPAASDAAPAATDDAKADGATPDDAAKPDAS